MGCANVQANVVASLLRGYKPNLSPLWQQPTFSPPLYDQFTLQPKPTSSTGRKLLQDVVQVRSLS